MTPEEWDRKIYVTEYEIFPLTLEEMEAIANN